MMDIIHVKKCKTNWKQKDIEFLSMSLDKNHFCNFFLTYEKAHTLSCTFVYLHFLFKLKVLAANELKKSLIKNGFMIYRKFFCILNMLIYRKFFFCKISKKQYNLFSFLFRMKIFQEQLSTGKEEAGKLNFFFSKIQERSTDSILSGEILRKFFFSTTDSFSFCKYICMIINFLAKKGNFLFAYHVLQIWLRRSESNFVDDNFLKNTAQYICNRIKRKKTKIELHQQTNRYIWSKDIQFTMTSIEKCKKLKFLKFSSLYLIFKDFTLITEFSESLANFISLNQSIYSLFICFCFIFSNFSRECISGFWRQSHIKSTASVFYNLDVTKKIQKCFMQTIKEKQFISKDFMFNFSLILITLDSTYKFSQCVKFDKIISIVYQKTFFKIFLQNQNIGGFLFYLSAIWCSGTHRNINQLFFGFFGFILTHLRYLRFLINFSNYDQSFGLAVNFGTDISQQIFNKYSILRNKYGNKLSKSFFLPSEERKVEHMLASKKQTIFSVPSIKHLLIIRFFLKSLSHNCQRSNFLSILQYVIKLLLFKLISIQKRRDFRNRNKRQNQFWRFLSTNQKGMFFLYFYTEKQQQHIVVKVCIFREKYFIQENNGKNYALHKKKQANGQIIFEKTLATIGFKTIKTDLEKKKKIVSATRPRNTMIFLKFLLLCQTKKTTCFQTRQKSEGYWLKYISVLIFFNFMRFYIFKKKFIKYLRKECSPDKFVMSSKRNKIDTSNKLFFKFFWKIEKKNIRLNNN